MRATLKAIWRGIAGTAAGTLLSYALALALAPTDALAVPIFARQTGQNCVACHAGGQFPELTPYGRMFKLTGYTIGERTIPVSVMGVLSATKTRNVDDTAQGGDPTSDFPKDGNAIFQTGSIFFGGKITENIGAFAQFTYDNYDSRSSSDSHWKGHGHSDNVDIRYADHFVDPGKDLVVGFGVNNNPTVQDVWNSAPAWLSPTVPGASPNLTTMPMAFSMGQNVVGASGYLYWNKHLYAEVAAYRTADRGVYSWFSRGFNTDRGDQSMFDGLSPYWRVAYTNDWGAHNIMVGAFGLTAKQYNDPVARLDTNRYRDLGVDSQYQYILDPHTVTAQLSYVREKIDYGVSQNSSNQSGNFLDPGNTIPQPAQNDNDTINFLRAKLTYVYQAKYGGNLTWFDVRGGYNAARQNVVYDNTGALIPPGGATGNATGKPDTNGMIYELFWMPIQYVRVGAQYTAYNKFNGASTNYDGFGRNAKDNNTLFLYVWGAY